MGESDESYYPVPDMMVYRGFIDDHIRAEQQYSEALLVPCQDITAQQRRL